VQRRRRRRIRGALAGATLVLALTAAMTLWPVRWSPQPVTTPPSSVVLSTPNKQLLPDGSVVELRDGAKIEVEFSPAARRVTLTQGMAHFTVAENKVVPFVVQAGRIAVRAVGTAFAVEVEARQIDVLVTEGVVAVDRASGNQGEDSPTGRSALEPAAPPLATVSAGRKVTVETETAAVTAVVEVSTAEQSERLAWRVPRIELARTPLSEALALFNRYSPVRLELADPALGALELSGVLRPDNPNALLHVLEADLGLEADRRADGVVVLRRR
jgi:transmembrane sensor